MDVDTRAEESAEAFIASLGLRVSAHDHATMTNAYIVGFIQGASESAANTRPEVCGRQRTRRRRTCEHNERG